jgi:type VI protein secretion system component Hcp
MILLKIPDIPGDSTVDGYTDWIACTSMSWALTREFKESAKAGTKDVFTGVAEIPPIEVGKSFDKSSIHLMQAACGGGSLGAKADIHCLASGVSVDKPQDSVYLKFTLENPMIASWQISGDEDDRPNETVQLWYWKIALEYYTWDGKTHKSAGKRGWDRTTNKSWSGT